MNNTPKYWLYTPGEQASKWDECVSQGIICLGWDTLGDLTKYSSREEIEEILSLESNRRATNDSLANWQFANEIKPGDIIFAKKGRNRILGMGAVTSSYEFDDSRPDYKSIVRVNWTDTGDWQTDNIAPIKTLTDITGFSSLVENYLSLVKHNIIADQKINYWLLCSKSRAWNIAEWRVGEDKRYSKTTGSGRPRPVYQNFDLAKPGDVVLCYDGVNANGLISVAVVSESADYEAISFEKVESFNNPIELSALKEYGILDGSEFFENRLTSGFYKLSKDQYDFLFDQIRELNPIPQKEISYEKYSITDFLNEVYITESELSNLMSVLKNKKNIILQGAPGVGKTFSAKRLAYTIMGEKATNRVAFVQFHQNYSYEDFVLGYKPHGADFILQKGVFYRFCIDAANNPDQDYFFIIDEINRGNVSKIFGELLMLIEKDYRGTKLTLAYKDERFFVPKNLYIIGMMNTADRSLSMIDYALRRRFGFIPLKPGFDSLGFIKYQKSLNSAKFDKLINVIKTLNDSIVADKSLGEGFELGHSYFCGQSSISDEWLKQVILYDIVPTLTEYWFDNKKEVDRWKSLLLDAING